MRAQLCFAIMAALILGCSESVPPPVAAVRAPDPDQSPSGIRAATVAENSSQTIEQAAIPPAIVEPLAPGEVPDVRYLPDDAFAAVVFNARRALQSRALAALPLDEILGPSLAAWNFDPREVEHWFLFFTPAVEGESLGTPYSPGAVMRFIRPVDGRTLIATRGECREARLGDATYYVQTGPQPVAFYIADERTIVFAAEKQLERMLSPGERNNMLASHLTATDRNFDLQLHLNPQPLTPALDAVSAAARQQLSAAVVPYVEALRDVSLITLTADLSGERLLTATVDGRDPEAAARVRQLAKESRSHLQLGYSMFRGTLVQAWRGEASQAVLDVTDLMMAQATVEYRETSLVLKVPKPPRLDDLGRRLRMARSP